MSASTEEELPGDVPLRRRFADAAAPSMFYLSLVFLAVLAALIVIWVDMAWIETSDSEGERTAILEYHDFSLENSVLSVSHYGIAVLGLIWPIFIGEFGLQFVLRDRRVPFWRNRYYWLATEVTNQPIY